MRENKLNKYIKVNFMNLLKCHNKTHHFVQLICNNSFLKEGKYQPSSGGAYL